MQIALRYDMRAPSFGASTEDLYAASLDMCEWGDKLGFETVYLAEHHGAEDGYCASPMVQAAAIAARTTHMRIHFSALLPVLHNPLRLAEDLATVDIISRGRVDMTLGLGYRLHEYAMFGVQKSKRVPILEETIEILEKAWTGEPFEYRGQTVMIRPTPVQKPRPPLYIGGSTQASAHRAAKYGDNYLPAGQEDLYSIYQADRIAMGLPPNTPPGPKGPLFLFVTEDPEQSWQDVAPHVIYTSNSNAEWAKERGVGSTVYVPATEIADLKASPVFEVVTPDE
ncbi:LLM class flavin-dependent oxidoreductase, partial [Jatrophihabitans endophyticus]|uniref:LLM class flavin-dependent oxidoreductase n=1 Tax=Jatrophihabitans endophyticus TaxID=1206085 RepID=UPI0019EA052C